MSINLGTNLVCSDTKWEWFDFSWGASLVGMRSKQHKASTPLVVCIECKSVCECQVANKPRG
jgi:hypothetical protein